MGNYIVFVVFLICTVNLLAMHPGNNEWKTLKREHLSLKPNQPNSLSRAQRVNKLLYRQNGPISLSAAAARSDAEWIDLYCDLYGVDDINRLHFYKKIYPFGFPLSFAVSHGHFNMVDHLLKRGAQINNRDTQGCTALMHVFLGQQNYFKEDSKYDIVLLLLQSSADPNIKNKAGQTALHAAAMTGASSSVVKLLVYYRVDINAQNNRGQTALHLAALKNNVEMVKSLLALGANHSIKSFSGQTFKDILLINKKLKRR